MDKNLRVKANILNDTVLNVNVTQDIKTLEILSLNLTQENYYKLHNSSYGVIIGRVLANDAFGIPNVKVSVFMKIEDDDLNQSDIMNLYPYTSVQSFDKEYRRYNLLPDESNNECYKIVGTFPNKRLVLDNDTVLEVYDKYWKYTTVTNNAGDYMIFGVPTGNQTIHADLDLSDIGVLSQKPRDMLFKGYNIEQFDSPTQFKEGTNLSNLSQIITQNQAVDVYPFWGDEDLGEIAISRCDINIDYKFEPTCVFMGSLVTDNGNEQISHKCVPSRFCGFNRNLIAGEGTIEMIRKTIDGRTEEFQLKGNHLIDENGVWCYQIPMNLDYVQTDEYGNIIPTDNPNKGIPTRTRVRFRVSFGEEDVEGSSKHRAKYLIPNNPELDDTEIEPHMASAGTYYEKYYEFGSATMDNCYRNLFWNKVYTVKSFIPRVQLSVRPGTRQYTGIRTTNSSDNLNPYPFNKARFKLFFVYRVICVILRMLVELYCFINQYIIEAIDALAIVVRKISFGLIKLCVNCLKFDAGLTDDNDESITYYPCCKGNAKKCTTVPSGTKFENDKEKLVDTIQQNLSQEFDTVNFDFYNDWVNGNLYFPVWYWRKTKKKKFLFGLFTIKAKNTFCRCDSTKHVKRIKNGYLCALRKGFPSIKDIIKGPKHWAILYKNLDGTDDSYEYWEKKYRNYQYLETGLIKEKTNQDNLNVYYYSYGNVTDTKFLVDNQMSAKFNRLFSTDIVLLGSFNDCDLDGVPKLFRDLPSTTANIPFITKLTEPIDDTEGSDNATENEGTSKDNGSIVITGMDWLNTGKDRNNDENNGVKYGAGLLFDLGCTDVKTKPKTLVNLERMSELGVSLDMSYNIPYTDGSHNELKEYETHPDGMITRYEINDNGSRHMFASLNHLGLESLATNKQTTYDVYKLGQMYPMDFDGMLTTAKSYTRGKNVMKTYDNLDSNYVEFRLGEIPHAYLNNAQNETYYPLYNNSFYFYFGLNAGNTALDKFKKQYDAQCYQNKEYPFNWQFTKQCGSWCQHSDKDLQKDYATITVDVIDISVPYSFKLYDSDNYLIFSGSNVTSQSLYFGYTVDNNMELVKNGNTAFIFDYNDNKPIEIFKTEGKTEYLTNQTYYLTITDNRQRSQTAAIDVEPVRMNVTIEKEDLATKYYGYNSTEINDICNKNGLYGTISFSDFSIDSNDYKIVSVDTVKQPFSNEGIYGYNIKLECPLNEQHNGPEIHHKYEYVFLYFSVASLQYDDLEETEQDKKDKTKNYHGNTKFDKMIIYDGNAEKKGQFTLYLDDEDSWWLSEKDISKRHNCGCQGNNPDSVDGADGYADKVKNISNYNITTLDFDKTYNGRRGKLTFRVWIPTQYTCTLIEYCDYSKGVLSDNIVQQTMTVENGKLFGATLDDMPVSFMLSAQTNTSSEDYSFYRNKLVNKEPTALLSWYDLFKMNVRNIGKERTIDPTNPSKTKYWHIPSGSRACLYSLPNYKQIDKIRIYEDYIPEKIELDSNSHITPNGVLTINKFLLNWTFSLAYSTYSLDENTATHAFKVVGGKNPSLVRCFKPRYEKIDNPDASHNLYAEEDISNSHYLRDKWYLDSNGDSTVNPHFPDIISSPYKHVDGRRFQYPQYRYVSGSVVVSRSQLVVQFNPHVDMNAPKSNFFLSTYFAGFSNYGGFIQDVNGAYVFNENAKGIERMPLKTNVIKDITPTVLDKEIHFSTYYGGNYYVLGQGDNQDDYKSYFPAPFIDRRFDYDLYIFNMGDSIRFMKGNVNHEKSIKFNFLTFVHGGTHNGLELTYADDTYDIINPVKDSNVNNNQQNREYAFKLENRDGFIVPGTKNSTYIDKVYYFNEDGLANSNRNHRFYQTISNGCDIQDLFYSRIFRRDNEDSSDASMRVMKSELQKTYFSVPVHNKAYHILGGVITTFGNLFYNKSTSNGRFDSTNFVTKRTLNYVVPRYSSFKFTNYSCSYDMETKEELDDNYGQVNAKQQTLSHLVAKTKSGEEVGFTINTSNFINMHINSLSDSVRLSTYNIMYMTWQDYLGNESYDKYNGKACLHNIRLTYSIREDDLCESTHNSLTCPQTLILTDDGREYEFLAHLHTQGSTYYSYFKFIPKNVPTGYEFVTKDPNTDLVRNGAINVRNGKSNPFDKRVLVNTSKADEALTFDSTDEAKECRFIVYNAQYSPINTSNASMFYQNCQCYQLDHPSSKYNYLGIGGIRRYVNSTMDNLEKSVHLINFNKIYAIHPFSVEYNHTVYTGTTDKVDVSLDLELETPSQNDKNEGEEQDEKNQPTTSSASANATGRAETYTKVELILDFRDLIQASEGEITSDSIISGVKGKIQNVDNLQVYESSNEKLEIEKAGATKIKLTLKYYGLRPYELNGENVEKGTMSCICWWQEIYLKMYNGLIYCLTYPQPTTALHGPFREIEDDPEVANIDDETHVEKTEEKN